MAKILGRDYPSDITGRIQSLGASLDQLMSQAAGYAAQTGGDLAEKVSALNTRLVNDVINASDQLTDDMARSRLLGIENDRDALQDLVRQEGLQALSYQPVSTGMDTVTLSKSSTEDLENALKKAYDLYGQMVSRYDAARPAIQSALALPARGAQLGPLLRDMDQKMALLDGNAQGAHDAIVDLSSDIDVGQDPVTIDRATFEKANAWNSGVFEANETLKRVEGFANRTPADETPVVDKTPWVLIAVAGLALVGAAWWAVSE